MRLQILASALALSGTAAAFSDSWPLVMFSTSKYDARLRVLSTLGAPY